jgi:hypothetical protein
LKKGLAEMSTWWRKLIHKFLGGRSPYDVTLEFHYPEGDTVSLRILVEAKSTLDATIQALEIERRSRHHFEPGYNRVNARVLNPVDS